MQCHPQSAQFCPYCAFTAMLGQFPVLVQNSGAGLTPLRKRGAGRFGPSVSPAAMPWPGLQQGTEGLVFPGLPAAPAVVADYASPSPAPAPAYVHERFPTEVPARRYPTGQISRTAEWPGLNIAGEGIALEFPSAARAARARRGNGLLAGITMGVLGLVYLLLRQPESEISRQPEPASAKTATAPTSRSDLGAVAEPTPDFIPLGNPPPTTVAAAPAVISATPTTAVSVLSPEQALEKTSSLLHSVFSAQAVEDRLSYFADAEEHRRRAEVFFAHLPVPLQLAGLKLFPTPIKRLPGGSVVPLFHVITSEGAQRSILCSLRSTHEGEVKLDWELFEDSYSGALANFQKVRQVNPRWFTVGLKKNHGFDESPEVRDSHLAFDVQCSFDGRDRTLALTTKTSNSGRQIDRAASWGELYIARVLLGWTPVNGEMRLTILDNAGVSEEIASAR